LPAGSEGLVSSLSKAGRISYKIPQLLLKPSDRISVSDRNGLANEDNFWANKKPRVFPGALELGF